MWNSLHNSIEIKTLFGFHPQQLCIFFSKIRLPCGLPERVGVANSVCLSSDGSIVSWIVHPASDTKLPLFLCCPCLWCVTGVSLSQCAVQASVQQWSRCSGRCLLGSVLPVWRPQWEDPDGHWFWSLPKASGAAHVSNWQVHIIGE